jgi:C4-dicarboxylate transporter/malic acid transport protein
MATGGLSLLLSPDTQPHSFPGLNTIGKVVYIWDIFLFTLITTLIAYRFIRWPFTLKASLSHPTESLFFSTSLLSLASLIAGIAHYGIPSCGPWLITTYLVLFWLYFALTFLSSIAAFSFLFTNPSLKIQDMTPAWDLPIFPIMLSGTIAASGAKFQHPENAIPMIVAGLTAQGLGFLVSVLMFASYLRRMIQYGFPSAASRPGMMIAVGPPSFTALAVIGMANAWPVQSGNGYFGGQGDPVVVKQVLLVLATVTAVFIWSLSLFFFCAALVAILEVVGALTFHLNWWALVFPNVGFTIAVISIGKEFRSEGVKWVGSAMTLGLVALYLFVLTMHVRAVMMKGILWEGKDEDVYLAEKKGKLDRTRTMDLERAEEED